MRQILLCVLATATLFLAGCPAPGVGDPCEPENVPVGGFVESEAYLETSSVQCRTRVCLVYHLQGDPRPEGMRTGPAASQTDIEQRIYCTCRCDAPDSTATVCECPSGYMCSEILQSGGEGVQGSYCIKSNPGVWE